METFDLTTRDVAKALQFSVKTIQHWAATGFIPAKKISGKWVITEKELKVWLAQKRKETQEYLKSKYPQYNES